MHRALGDLVDSELGNAAPQDSLLELSEVRCRHPLDDRDADHFRVGSEALLGELVELSGVEPVFVGCDIAGHVDAESEQGAHPLVDSAHDPRGLALEGGPTVRLQLARTSVRDEHGETEDQRGEDQRSERHRPAPARRLLGRSLRDQAGGPL